MPVLQHCHHDAQCSYGGVCRLRQRLESHWIFMRQMETTQSICWQSNRCLLCLIPTSSDFFLSSGFPTPSFPSGDSPFLWSLPSILSHRVLFQVRNKMMYSGLDFVLRIPDAAEMLVLSPLCLPARVHITLSLIHFYILNLNFLAISKYIH